MSTLQKQLALFLFLLLLGTGCKKGVHWGYEGKEGPENWGGLSKEFVLCKEGKSQSPIDITGEIGKTGITLGFNYSDVSLDMVNNGHAIQVNYGGENYILIGDKKFRLLQFHFHSPSEGAIMESVRTFAPILFIKVMTENWLSLESILTRARRTAFLSHSGAWYRKKAAARCPMHQ
jgi:carbonic anhydrase